MAFLQLTRTSDEEQSTNSLMFIFVQTTHNITPAQADLIQEIGQDYCKQEALGQIRQYMLVMNKNINILREKWTDQAGKEADEAIRTTNDQPSDPDHKRGVKRRLIMLPRTPIKQDATSNTGGIQKGVMDVQLGTHACGMDSETHTPTSMRAKQVTPERTPATSRITRTQSGSVPSDVPGTSNLQMTRTP